MPARYARLAAALAAGLAVGLAAPTARAERFDIVLLGDAPYGDPGQVYAPFETLIDAINARAPDLVIHVGDTKAGGTPCSDAVLAEQLRYLDSFEAPTVYTPGDNEWTDCHRASAGGFDPLERLAHIRRTYFADPSRSFGRAPVALEHQGDAGYPENARLVHAGVMVVTAHVVGSNNNFDPDEPDAMEEFRARDAANIAWVEGSFAEAARTGAVAVVLAIHADMFEPGPLAPVNEGGFARHSGYTRFAAALVEQANRFARPVLLVFGDSHRFRVFRPFARSAPTVTALETFGARDMHAVEIAVDTGEAFPFGVRPVLNPAVPLARR